jgi:hypothetical protein
LPSDGFWNKVYGQNNATSTGALSSPQPGKVTGKTGDVPPAAGEGIFDFTCLLGIPLSSQAAYDEGNLGLLRGGHRMLQQGFRAQRAAGGPRGPDGPGWPRFNSNGSLSAVIVHGTSV